MKQQFLLLSSILLSFLFSSCIFSPSITGNGNVTEQKRSIDDFDELKVSRGMNVYITYGEETKLVVRADENLHKVIETEVLGDVLTISAEANIKRAKEKKVFVTTPNLKLLKGSSGSNIFSENQFVTKELLVSASSGSNIKLDIKADKVSVSASSGSNMKLKGVANSLEAKASSGSNIRADDLKAKDCDAKVSSGANIWVTATEKINGKASSGGNVFYYGDPSQTEINRSSGGNVLKQ